MEVKDLVQDLLTKVINPALGAHGGQAILTGIDEEGVVSVKLTGACASCMVAADTFDNVVKRVIMENAGDKGVTDVVLDQSVSEDLLDFARKILKDSL